jgi:hypothetical protein
MHEELYTENWKIKLNMEMDQNWMHEMGVGKKIKGNEKPLLVSKKFAV